MTKNSPIYFDYAATTPVAPSVIEKMNQCLAADGIFGNPASTHFFGSMAKAVVEAAREAVASLIHCVPRNLIFTSGATEANNLALKGVAHFNRHRGNHIVTCKTEHKAILDTCAYLEQEGFTVTYLDPEPNGLIDLGSLQSALCPQTILVSIMQVNNETGVIQDIASIGKMVRDRGIVFHVDAAQSVGKIPLDVQLLPVDLLSISAHKCYGPKGIGALYVNDIPRIHLTPQLHGGGQERKMRAGTLPTHQIAGLGEAARLVQEKLAADSERIREFSQQFWHGIQDLPGVTRNGEEKYCVPHILNVTFSTLDKEAFIQGLPQLAFSSASACNSISLEPSHVLRAMGLAIEAAKRSFRFSFGRFTTRLEVEQAVNLIRELVLNKGTSNG